jgi:hypothetical protein
MIEEISGTSEQTFMIMLKERIDKLEDEVTSLRKKLEEHEALETIHNASRFHYLSLLHKKSLKLTDILNIVFRNRCAFEPVFASWKQYNNEDDDDDDCLIYIVIATSAPISYAVFQKLIEHEDIKIQNHESLDYAMLKTMFFCEHGSEDVPRFYPSTNCDIQIEYWWRFCSDFDTDVDLNPYMSNDLFTISDNYGKSKLVQQYLERCIYSDKLFNDLLRFDYM